MANLNIKLVKSLNGRIAKHKATAEALGLRKIGDELTDDLVGDGGAGTGNGAHVLLGVLDALARPPRCPRPSARASRMPRRT